MRSYLNYMRDFGLIKTLPAGQVEYALDLGCGKGIDSVALETFGYKVVSVDKEKNYDKAITSDIREFNIDADKYSVIICNNTIPFLNKEDVEPLLIKMKNGLKTGGCICFSLYGVRESVLSKSKRHHFEPEEADALVKSLGLEVVRIEHDEGLSKTSRNEPVYEHCFRYILRK